MDNLIIKKADQSDSDLLPGLLYELDQLHFSAAPEKYKNPEEMHRSRLESDIFSQYCSGKFSVYIALQDDKVTGMVSGLVRERETLLM
jgi:hypothetical protein